MSSIDTFKDAATPKNAGYYKGEALEKVPMKPILILFSAASSHKAPSPENNLTVDYTNG